MIMESENDGNYGSSSFEDEAAATDTLISAPSKRQKRSSRRTDDQYKLLKLNVPASNPSSVDQTLAWKNLSKQLNELGPPCHSTSGWRKLWTSHKAKAKRKMTASDYEKEFHFSPCDGGSLDEPGTSVRNNHSVAEHNTDELPCVDETKREIVEMSRKIGILLNQQSALTEQQKMFVDCVKDNQKILIEQQKTLIDQQKTLIEKLLKAPNQLN